MSVRPSAETIEAGGCEVVLRRVIGPDARELWALARPIGHAGDAAAQATAAYGALAEMLAREGADFGRVVWERVHLRDRDAALRAVRAARASVAGARPSGVSAEVEQPPVDDRLALEVSIHAVVPREGAVHRQDLPHAPACPCADCGDTRGLLLSSATETQLLVGAVHGRGDTPEDETLAMFEEAERVLRRADMDLGDVVRTWIHVRDIGRDYDALNRGRRRFFEARGIDPAPASTGIGGGPVAGAHALVLGFRALRPHGSARRAGDRVVMSAPTLNEAPQYGADFVRGLRVVEGNRVSLHVSGTASIDEAGRTAHVGDLDAQADRMLLNVRALLEGQGAEFSDIVSAITYVKRAEDGPRLRARLEAAGYVGFPNAFVVATVCRPDLLCETEALAVLSHDAPDPGTG